MNKYSVEITNMLCGFEKEEMDTLTTIYSKSKEDLTSHFRETFLRFSHQR